MATEFDQYFTYEARLASFQRATRKRGSTTGGRAAKALNWPHKQISIASLARAGFVFRPSPDSPDNTVCFLCGKGLDGWEAGDDPIYEHVKHAPHCGWAIVAAIEVDIGDYGREDPNDPEMIEARRATFADRWPHENKKGWKCKTKQLVDAGWKYTPTEESDDMATCTYCQLALDGWEQGDKPLDEHYNRSPDCPFFSLISQYRALGKGSGRGKASRNSASSVQSYGTAAADISNASDVSVGPEDSLLTTASSASQLDMKKPRAKKGAAAKAGRKKIQKDDQSELDQSSQMEEETQRPKARRGKKRPSDAVEDPVLSSTDGPISKKRASRTPSVGSIDGVHEYDSEATDISRASYKKNAAQPPSKRGRKGAPKLISHASMASLRARGGIPDDDEIERELEADLNRQFTDDEEISYDSDLLRNKPRSPEYAMFDPAVPEPAQDELDDELKALQAEMEVDEAERPPKPKRGRKAESQQEEEGVGSADISAGSTAAGKRGRGRPRASLGSQDESATLDVAESSQQSIKRGPGRPPSRLSLASLLSAETGDAPSANAPIKRARGRPSNASLLSLESTGSDEDILAAPAPAPKPVEKSKDALAPGKRGRGRPAKKVVEAIPVEPVETEAEDDFVEAQESVEEPMRLPRQSPVRAIFSPRGAAVSLASGTPSKLLSPVPSARQAVLSPSQSPQSSDAENQPPSNLTAAKRLVLAPKASTPTHGSPSKRNVMAGVRSTTPWVTASLEAIFETPLESPGKENEVDRFLKRGKELTSPERRMTVEEWIYFNAAEAEKKLKFECESLVNRFEMEGTRAIKVLEGLEVDETS
ncbi:inhibitor of apoptosis domain-containing protein [Trichoderma breve]|uniref:Inhibitor of apoptosis domain-containing protein n=1 Tax=Trichoderma breve TaxID=2034170 RepID=A0A9W9E588_9HYPO|nr:inhibitor of apoptosis domain-containing protein [Trichoderma breve]KAJ4858649.1 inhibitor of apoptosis domain-containing protein [Trichoderma breve]